MRKKPKIKIEPKWIKLIAMIASGSSPEVQKKCVTNFLAGLNAPKRGIKL